MNRHILELVINWNIANCEALSTRTFFWQNSSVDCDFATTMIISSLIHKINSHEKDCLIAFIIACCGAASIM